MRFSVTNPASGELIADVADAGVEDGIAAVDAADDALSGWSAGAPRERAEILRRAFELIIASADGLADLVVSENGKTRRDAVAEIAYAAEFFRWYAEEAVRSLGAVQTAPSGSNQIVVVRRPIGIAVLVTPWNFPAAMATRKIAPALAAGCTVVLKPAPETPLTALALAAILADAGVPDGVVNVLPSSRSAPLVAAMLHDPRVRKLSFTGSTEVGRMLLASAADSVLSCSMELGGNAPFLVFADADLDAAIEGAMVAKMRNGGEACTAANRFLIERPVFEAFAALLSDRFDALRVGPGLDPGSDLGPLIDEAARTKVADLVGDAVARGATVRTGGSSVQGPGFFYEPTVLIEVPTGARILHEEVFGPVAPIVAFDSEDEAVAIANATEYGLVAYVFTGDLGRGMRVADRIESGMVGVNRGLVSDPAAPFGGVKQSGIGREGGHEGLLEFTESKYLALQW